MAIKRNLRVIGEIVRAKNDLLKLSICWWFICEDTLEKNPINVP